MAKLLRSLKVLSLIAVLQQAAAGCADCKSSFDCSIGEMCVDGKCRSPSKPVNDGGLDSGVDSGAADSGARPDSGGGDSESDSSVNELVPDCSNCPSVGATLDRLRCAIDLCDEKVFRGQKYDSPTDAGVDGTYEAVERFGIDANDLNPMANGSYSLMATGPATGIEHNKEMGGFGTSDPFSKDGYPIFDAMEWRISLKAPLKANGFEIRYVFMSEEYDEFVGSPYNDKFYIFIEAASTNKGRRTVINFTECRDPGAYSDFVCDDSMIYCEKGKKYCYVAINTALSECCWYPAEDPCPNGLWKTDLSGTGYSCSFDILSDGPGKGSSTGWLVTKWTIEPEEEFDIIFHIHDTNDHQYDSEVILDGFYFLTSADPGTTPVE